MLEHPQVRREQDRVRLACERTSEPGRIERGQPSAELRPRGERTERGPRGHRAERLHPAPIAEQLERPRRHLLQAEDVRAVLGRQPDHPLEVQRSPRRVRAPVEHVPGADQHRITLGAVRIVLADPSSFTPEYDHELAAALVRGWGWTSSWSHPAFDSARCRIRRAIAEASCSTRSARASSDARGCESR